MSCNFFFFNSVTISHEKSCYITEHQSEVDTTKSVGGGPSWSWSPLENRFLFFSILSKLQIFTIRSPISCQKVNKRLERRLVITITGPKSIRHCYGRGATLRTWWYGNWGGNLRVLLLRWSGRTEKRIPWGSLYILLRLSHHRFEFPDTSIAAARGVFVWCHTRASGDLLPIWNFSFIYFFLIFYFLF